MNIKHLVDVDDNNSVKFIYQGVSYSSAPIIPGCRRYELSGDSPIPKGFPASQLEYDPSTNTLKPKEHCLVRMFIKEALKDLDKKERINRLDKCKHTLMHNMDINNEFKTKIRLEIEAMKQRIVAE